MRDPETPEGKDDQAGDGGREAVAAAPGPAAESPAGATDSAARAEAGGTPPAGQSWRKTAGFVAKLVVSLGILAYVIW
jgi:hypothetical protein